jgi:DNA-3-methyladenine glycosylase II
MIPLVVAQHFAKVDPLLHEVIASREQEVFSYIDVSLDPKEYFYKLCQAIISQQLAGKAADAIFNRFLDLFPDRQVTAERLMDIPEQAIRDIGASWAKARYIKDLGEKTAAGAIKYTLLNQLTDEEVILELTQVKGIGRWTAEMFLIFTLGRPDVFSLGDLGLKNAFKKLYKVEDAVTVEKMKKISASWSPYRSYASLTLWSYLDNR